MRLRPMAYAASGRARKPRNFIRVIRRHQRGETNSQAVDEKVLPRARTNNSRPSGGGTFLTGSVVSTCGAVGLAEEGRTRMEAKVTLAEA
jgi:hypothetical protein